MGRAVSVRSPNSSLRSGHRNSAARKRPVGSAYFRPTSDDGSRAISEAPPKVQLPFVLEIRRASSPRGRTKVGVGRYMTVAGRPS
ncbi:hypothetical protein FSB08_16255 [Paraburkholderia sp. JPY432]|nr:hypothetical protein [Paraburkholderia youngii]